MKDFIWLIIDDGSTDNTKQTVEEWQQAENDFAIRYVYKENGGLHTGYNEAIRLADTELMVCVDSDDYMPDNAVETILDFWKRNGSSRYAGIAALDMDEGGRILGDPFPEQKEINLIDVLVGRYKFRNADRKLVIRTELYKQVAPMPSFGSEKNFNPHYMHLQISRKYNFLVLNPPLCVVEYQADGMTSHIFRQYLDSPRSFAQTRRLYLSFRDAPWRFHLKTLVHYGSSCILAKENPYRMISRRDKILVTLALPFSLLLTLYIWKRGRERG